MITALNGIVASSIASVSYDADAQLFFNAESAAGVSLTLTQKSAINEWVIDAKAAGIWTKMKAVYPIVGGTATSHKFNLKNPLDTDAAFRLVFSGGWIHSSNGALPNGTNAYANTFCTTANMALNNAHHSFYSRTDQVAANAYEMGVYQTTPNCNTALSLKTQTGAALFGKVNNSGTGTTSTANSNSTGFYITSRTASNLTKTFKNNSLFQTATQLSGAVSTNPYFISANNNLGSPSNYSLKESAFVTIGDGLTDLESQVFYQITEKYQVALGRNINATQSFYYNTAYNNETNAFLFSTQITNTTIQTATNTLVTDLKTAGVYTKMRAIYPMVGGTATTNQYNLINPQNSNAANRLSFNGAWTHSSNGALPSGSGGSHADTYISGLAQNSTHLLYYSRTNSSTDSVDMGVTGTNSIANRLSIRKQGAGSALINSPSTDPTTITVADSRGCFMANRTASNVLKFIKNGITLTTYTTASTGVPATFTLLLAATTNSSGSVIFSSNKECAFASAGDGLTDLESQVFYQIIEKFQVALGRSINPTQSFYYNTAYNNETNAFLFSTQITDNTIQTATNTLVTDLKTAGVYTKMKALYPMVGGTATTHKFNLINPQDTDAAFRLSFVGGWTHSANGALPNGTNAYADTKLIPSTSLTSNNHHLSFYSRTNNTTTSYDLACQSIQAASSQYGYMTLGAYNSGTSYYQQQTQNTNAITPVESNTLGFYNGTRISSTSFKGIKNGVVRGTNTALASTIGSYLAMNSLYLGAFNLNNNGAISTIAYSNRECAFSSIGDGLTDAEALAYYNAVNNFQVTLGRNV